MTAVRGHRSSRPNVGGPAYAMPLTLLKLKPDPVEPVLPVASLTSLSRAVLCDESCPWPLTCSEDATCWKAEPAHYDFTGALQARAERKARG